MSFGNTATLQTLPLILMQMKQFKKNVFQQFMVLRSNKVILLMGKNSPYWTSEAIDFIWVA